MTANKRIALNVVATYGRSLLGLFSGLFVSRWVLAALGSEAFGVYGVVGILLVIINLFSGLLSSSMSRYYAFEVGKMQVASDTERSIAEMKEWFNSSLLLQLIMIIVLTPIAYFAGEWAIDNYFNIPNDLQSTAHWVFYFALLTAAVSVISIPFRALFVAQQLIAELTLYEILVPIFRIGLAYWLLCIVGDRLFYHSFYTMALVVVPSVIIDIRALFIFPFCKIGLRKFARGDKVHNLLSFAGWQLFGWIGLTVRAQGCATIINKLLGVEYNATMTMSSTIEGNVGALSQALNGAFSPAVTNAAGASNRDQVYNLCLKTCKFGSFLCAILAIPLLFEIDYVIRIWLTVAPPALPQLGFIMLIGLIVSKLTGGMLAAILATGEIKLHEIGNGALFLLSLMISYISIAWFGLGILGIGVGYLVYEISIDMFRLYLWKKQLGYSLYDWFAIQLRFIAVTLVVCVLAGIVRLVLPESFLRVIVISCVCLLSYSVLGALFVLSPSERAAIGARLLRLK